MHLARARTTPLSNATKPPFQQTVHKESWEVSAGEGVRQLFSPGSEVVRSKIPPVER